MRRNFETWFLETRRIAGERGHNVDFSEAPSLHQAGATPAEAVEELLRMQTERIVREANASIGRRSWTPPFD